MFQRKSFKLFSWSPYGKFQPIDISYIGAKFDINGIHTEVISKERKRCRLEALWLLLLLTFNKELDTVNYRFVLA